MYPTDMSVVTDRRWVLWGWLVSRVPAADMMTPMIMFLVVAARGILGGGRFGKQIYRFFFFFSPSHSMVNMTAFAGTRIIHQPGVCDEKITRSRTRDMADTYAERGHTSHAVRSNSKPELAATALPQLRMVGWGGMDTEWQFS